MKTTYRVVEDGPYSGVVLVECFTDDEQLTFSQAKRDAIDYLQGLRNMYRDALSDLHQLRKSDVTEDI